MALYYMTLHDITNGSILNFTSTTWTKRLAINGRALTSSDRAPRGMNVRSTHTSGAGAQAAIWPSAYHEPSPLLVWFSEAGLLLTHES